MFAVWLLSSGASWAAQQNLPSPPSAPGTAVSPSTQERLDQFQALLKKAVADGDARRQAAALFAIGEIYLMTEDTKSAMENLSSALSIAQALKLRQGEAMILTDMGGACREASKEQEALDYSERALAIFRELGNRKGESSVLNNLAIVYYDLGENQKALEDYEKALAIFQEQGDRASQGMALNNLGRLYHDMGQDEKALDSLNRAIPLLKETEAVRVEGRALKNLGNIFRDRGETGKALDSYNRALEIMNRIDDRSGQSMTLDEIGSLRARQGERQKALDAYKQALAVAVATSQTLQAAVVYGNLMRLEQSSEPGLAVYYGKQAVNLIQQVRGEMRGLGDDLQKSFLRSRSDAYRNLADLLIGLGRLSEAQQVLDLLKQQEYAEYVRGEKTDPLSPLALTPAEQKAEEDYQKSTAQIVTGELRWAELKKTAPRTPEQESEFQQLSQQLSGANLGLDGFYSRLYALFSSGAANRQVADVKGNISILNQIIRGAPHTVALYTAVAKDRYSVIVITGTGPAIGRKYEIAETTLNQKIAAFQQVLRNPANDPRPQAQELYNILIGPIEADLQQAKAQTLVWSLDGALRYIPMAALYDGKRYVVERYDTVTFTPASVPFLQSKPELENTSAVAMGISRKYQDGLSPLPTVVSELNYIVKDPRVQGAGGVLPGTILLDGQFTEKAMEDQLGNPHAVVHIASHFVLQPGDDSQSYLLLSGKDSEGTGYHLTVADFRDNLNLSLTDTELLTLSACETGVNSYSGNGREVDGLATTAQLKGAHAILSTLWPVNDSSTGQFMSDFYQRWVGGGGRVAKSEALREAQLDLLRGTGRPLAAPSSRGLLTEDSAPSALPGFSHPFYWAPFVLMGNWK